MSKRVLNLKWRNKFSKEEGYVKSTSPKKGCFYNTFEKSEAKKYTNETMINKDLAFLNTIGETNQNEFFVVEQ